MSGTSNSKDLAQIIWWSMLTAFLNRNYEVLSMWLDYKATIVVPHSEMNSSFICTFSSYMETTSLLLSHSATSCRFWLKPLLNSDITINGKDYSCLLISGFSMWCKCSVGASQNLISPYNQMKSITKMIINSLNSQLQCN